MFFPINDTESTRYGLTPMTMAIILMNTLIWILDIVLIFSEHRHLRGSVFRLFGSTPEMIFNREGLGAATSITATFLHGGFIHLLGNMWALWVFGRRVEDACGPWRFLVFYLLCGATGDFSFVFIHHNSSIPAIGASGAVYGVMGAYMLLYPEGRIRTLIMTPLPLWPKIRAFWVVLFFIILEIPPALDVLLNRADYSTAHWAHIGGFFGALSIIFFLRPEAFRRYINHLPI
jgi:membrane associated rhomboid family serine protease